MTIHTFSQNGVPGLPTNVAPSNLADAIRFLSVDAIEKAQSGHPGMPLGMADVMVALMGTALKYDPENPQWPDRDRLVLSAGHGSMLLYAALHLTGYAAIDRAALENFRTLDAVTAGHPELEIAAGIEMTTGPLGQGIATAVGMALAERMLNDRFGDELVDHHTYVIAGDGDLMEGVSHEACSLAGHLGLSRLIVLFDDNRITIDGAVSLSCSDDATARFRSYGWAVDEVDGHDVGAVSAVLARARDADRPTLIRCHTEIAHGAPGLAGDAKSHSGALGEDEIAAMRKTRGWSAAPFDVPDDIAAGWRSLGNRGKAASAKWRARYDACSVESRKAFDDALAGTLPEKLSGRIHELKRAEQIEPKAGPTRMASGRVLDVLTKDCPLLVGGSGDLTPANNTLAEGFRAVQSGDYGGRYLHFGIREHGMAAAMNGLALHGGFIPYGGSFMAFTDYMRPAMRLGALMGQRVIHVMTHDSIGIGQDGPTHQPVEHLASLRAMPGLKVFRPADAVEVAECWELALHYDAGPSVLSLSRQEAPLVRFDDTPDNRCAKGAYILSEAQSEHRITLVSTGTEVALALAAQKVLEERGIGARVVSMPCWSLFDEQGVDYRASVLGVLPRLAVEAASPLGWHRYHGDNGDFIGVTRFGASAPAEVIYESMGITPDGIVARAEQLAVT